MAEVSRRGLFGVAAGAAAAGPAVAKSVLAELDAERNRPVNWGLWSTAASTGPDVPDPVSEASWMQQKLREALIERKNVKAIAPDLGRVEDVRIDGLRSVSAAQRARMILEARARREEQERASYFERRIADLKAKLGPLAALVSED